MSDRMRPIPFGQLMTWVLEEQKKGTIFGLHRPFKADPQHSATIFGRPLETPFGPAAGPHTQLAENIIAAYVAGSRFFELKTVQKLDGEDLPVAKPCIKADDEGYNVEWSTELYVPQAFEEYVKAWFVLKVIAKEFDLGSMDGFQFNMSVGYDLEGIKLPKIDTFIENLKDAAATPIFKECRNWLKEHAGLFQKLTAQDIDSISPAICNSATISTLHGCPPQEIERIARHLLENKKVHTFIKCNPTLLGYEYARKTMDEMGYDYVAFGDFHFKDDLQYSDAVPMLQRLQELADAKGLAFGVKITNTFPVDIKAGELPGNEMYMSGKSLFALSMSVALKLAKDFKGKLRIAYSGGADYFNITKIVAAGIWPVTMATTLLKPGGYQRLSQMGEAFAKLPVPVFTGVDAAQVEALVEGAKTDKHHVKAIKPLPSRKINKPVPLTDCFIAPCQEGCPIHQDITTYLQLTAEGRFAEALAVITSKNPLPFITGTICAHNCMSKCTRNFYDQSVNIRRTKLEAAEGGYDAFMAALKRPALTAGKTAVVVGGGPAGLAAAYFLAKGGLAVTLLDKAAKMGGVVRQIIPGFRISEDAIDKDVRLVEAMGVNMVTGREVTDLAALQKTYDYVVLALGAHVPGSLRLETGTAVNVLSFLAEFNATKGKVNLGKQVIVVGGGNTAMDTARAATRNAGVEKVSLVYRRTKRYMPADAEELELALADGVEFAELLAPVKLEAGRLLCEEMQLGAADASGRRGVVATGKTVSLPADTVIAAVGEKVPTSFYTAAGLAVDAKGRPQVDRATLESSVQGVYVVGDGLFGPATVVEGIRDGKLAAEAIVGHALSQDVSGLAAAAVSYGRKGVLAEEQADQVDAKRCLSCSSYCENCVEVCPNRANIAITVPGMSKHQIVHVDGVCNECGNCRSFCPWDSAPYQDKLTLFGTEADFADSKNQGFLLLDAAKKLFKVRLGGKVSQVSLQEKGSLPQEVAAIMETVLADYSYLFYQQSK